MDEVVEISEDVNSTKKSVCKENNVLEDTLGNGETKLKSDCILEEEGNDEPNSEKEDIIPETKVNNIGEEKSSDVIEDNESNVDEDVIINSIENGKDLTELNSSTDAIAKTDDSENVDNELEKPKIENPPSEKDDILQDPPLEAMLEDAVEENIAAKVEENNVLTEEAKNTLNSLDEAKEETSTIKDVKVKESESKTSQDTSEVSKKKEESVKKKKGKTCIECGKKRKIEFRIHFQGKVLALCSEPCYKQFKAKQGSPKPPVELPKAVEPAQESTCPQCQKLIYPNQGYFPVVGEVKPLCSEDCVRKYQDNNGPLRKCSHCEKKVEDKSCHLTWETMVFCSEECLGKYQSFLGSHCTCCQAPVQQASLGKYCVCFGSDIRQFCSGSCLDDFKKGLKVCTFCQTDLSAGTEGFLAPVGDKGQFKDFCSQACMERYETMNNLSKTAPEVQECAHCKKQGTFKIQVPHLDKKYSLCCDNCVAGLRCSLKKSDNVCASCHHFFKCVNDVNGNKENDYKFKMDGLYKFFCSKTCMTTYVLSHRRITQCLFCKVKKYNFDMIEKTDRNIGSEIFCSLNCLSLYRVNVNAASSKSIRCDNCSKSHPAQFHLTMSDGSIRNFCAYNCVLAFQNQFTSVPALTTTSMTRQMTTPVQTLKTTPAISSPVIANVVSLAQPRSGAPNLAKPLIPQTLVSVRPPRQPVAVFTSKPQISSSTVTSPSLSIGQSTNSSTQVMREVIVQPPAPKSVKNKTVWCKPIMQTKGVNAKTPACHKAVQTDDNPRPLILPVPVPVYVPTPLHMFSRPVPCPVPFPVPIPIPIIIRSSKGSEVKHVKRGNMSSNCHEKDPFHVTSAGDANENSTADIVKQSDEDSTEDVLATEPTEGDGVNNAESDESLYYVKQTRNSHKRVHTSHKHKKHKKNQTGVRF